MYRSKKREANDFSSDTEAAKRGESRHQQGIERTFFSAIMNVHFSLNNSEVGVVGGHGKMIERIPSLEPLIGLCACTNYKCDPIRHHVPLLCQLVREEREESLQALVLNGVV